jgi:hypothetical protein
MPPFNLRQHGIVFVLALLPLLLAYLLFLTASCVMTMKIGGLGVGSAAAISQTTGPNVQMPPQIPLDVERYPVVPQGLELQQVHIFVRHGKAGFLPHFGLG